MKTQTNDRRVRRTRLLLHEALISLIIEKPYQSITVQDILDRADVGRSTFYSHFQDKDDLFRYGFELMLDALTRHMDASNHTSGPPTPALPILELFQHIQENNRLYKALIGGQGLELMFEYGQQALSERIERHLETQVQNRGEISIPLPVLSTYLAGTLITLLQWWLDKHMPYSPEQMDAIYRQLALPGVMEVIRPIHSSPERGF